MGYAEYIRGLLRPVGIYTFAPGSIGNGEIESIGAVLDGCEAAAEESEREVLVPTAKDWGLATLELRRAAILALLQISGDGFTIESINRALSGCGIRAVVAETGQSGRVRVTFPNTAGIPEEFDQIAGIITDIIPCHLETEFYFRYLTWVELEARFTSWESIEQGGYTWEQLELAV